MIAKTVFWLAVAVVVAGSLGPPPGPPDGLPVWDKLQHFVAYGGLAVLGMAAFRRPLRGWPLAAGLVALGIVLEVLQGLTPPREPDPFDALANTAGVALAFGLIAGAAALRRLWRRRRGTDAPA